MTQFVLKDISHLPKIAKLIINCIKDSKIIAFYGNMGAGKTTIIKAICKELGIEKLVTSPTFALVNEYSNNQGLFIYHFDFYRINKVDELFDMGYEDYFYSGNLCFIEWPELAEELLPENTLKIQIKVGLKELRTINILN
jgi:tRNA threonylcarbamoyladenosine biosynthesis protein TsaE